MRHRVSALCFEIKSYPFLPDLMFQIGKEFLPKVYTWQTEPGSQLIHEGAHPDALAFSMHSFSVMFSKR
jgi:hypothetical protein